MLRKPKAKQLNKAFVDTNVFIRYFTEDDQIQSDAAERLLKKAANGEVQLFINDLLITEVAWVLRRSYKLSNEQVRVYLLTILSMSGLQLRPADLTNNLSQAIDLAVIYNIDFSDAYFSAWMLENKISTVYTFNQKHSSRIPKLNAIVP